MLDPIVVAAFVTILAWLLGLGAKALNIPIGVEILNGLAATLVVYLLSLFGLGVAQRYFTGLVKRGILSAPKK